MYTELVIQTPDGPYILQVCKECGAAVANVKQHDDFHRKIVEQLGRPQ